MAAPDEKAFYDVLNRMCAELKESHLGALPPRRAHEFQTDHRAAVGIRWQLLEGQRVITDVVPSGPAARAGIELGWTVISRNGVPLREGEPFVSHVGETVTYGFLDRKNLSREFSLKPELLSFERLEARKLDEELVYLRFDTFSRQSLRWLSQQLKEHASARGVLIDLRQNSGGNVLALNVAVAEFFQKRVAEGRMIRRNGSQRETRSLSWLSAHYSGRVVLLTGPLTASAAEIFAHVLQYHGRAEVIGQRTAGAVIFSRTYGLADGGTVQIPVMDYIGLNGERLEGHGVVPNREVPRPTLADLRAARDPEAMAAIETLKTMIRLPATGTTH
jgi:carboxyl-terminal processing protease